MAKIELDGITRHFEGNPTPAVSNLSLDIADGEFLVLVGPSGCGKSTILRSIAGLETVDSGSIRIGGTEVTNLPPRKRDIAMIFQNYALYPHLDVAENIGFHLKLKKTKKPIMSERVNSAASTLDLIDLLKRKPAKLSGDNVRELRWVAQSCGNRACFLWMSHSQTSTHSCGSRCEQKSCNCSDDSAPRRSM